MKTLIFSTTYLNDSFKVRTFELLVRTIRKRYAGLSDFLVVDSDSPDIARVFAGFPGMKYPTDELFDHVMTSSVELVSFRSNIGHLNYTGNDGWGRAVCQGIKIAIDNGYDHAVYVEQDLIPFFDLIQTVEDMAEAGIGFLSAMDPNHHLLETGLMFINCDCARDTGFVDAYDWKITDASNLPEKRIQRITSDYCYFMDLNGIRAENLIDDETLIANIDTFDYLTHFSSGVLSAIEKRLEREGLVQPGVLMHPRPVAGARRPRRTPG